MINSLKFHHVGIGTTMFEDAISVYLQLGYELICSIDDADLDLRVAFVRKDDSPYIELLAPLSPDGPLKSFLARGLLPSPYHTCYETSDINESGDRLQQQGFFPVTKPRPSRALNGALFAYFYHAAIGLLELVEGPTSWPHDGE